MGKLRVIKSMLSVEMKGEGAYYVVIMPGSNRSIYFAQTQTIISSPKPNIPVPMIGIIQCIAASADHPYQLMIRVQHETSTNTQATYKSPTGTNSEPTINAGILISGVPLPPFFSASCGTSYNELCFNIDVTNLGIEEVPVVSTKDCG